MCVSENRPCEPLKFLLARRTSMEDHPALMVESKSAAPGVDTGRGEVIAMGTPMAPSPNPESTKGNF